MLGLGRLARAGWVHQDIKPGNLLYNRSRIWLSDFGLACRSVEVLDPERNPATLDADYAFFPPECTVAFPSSVGQGTGGHKLAARRHQTADQFVRKERGNLVAAAASEHPFVVSGTVVTDLASPLAAHIHRYDGGEGRAAHLRRLHARFRPTRDARRLARRVDTYGLGMTLFLLYLAAGLHQPRRCRTTTATAVEKVRRFIALLCHPNPYERPEVGAPLLRLYDETLRALLQR